MLVFFVISDSVLNIYWFWTDGRTYKHVKLGLERSNRHFLMFYRQTIY